MQERNPWYTLPRQISSGSVHCVAFEWQETPNSTVLFKLQWSVVAPSSSAETKLTVDAQLQAFPHPAIPKLFLNSNCLVVISRPKTSLFNALRG